MGFFDFFRLFYSGVVAVSWDKGVSQKTAEPSTNLAVRVRSMLFETLL